MSVNPNKAPRRSNRLRLYLFLSAVPLLLLVRSPLESKLITLLLSRAEAPGSEELSEQFESVSDKEGFLASLWNSGKIPQRQFVISQLKEPVVRSTALSKVQRRILGESLCDPDMSVREVSLGIVASQKADPDLLQVFIRRQLSDCDPEARLFACRYLRLLPASQAAPLAMQLLEDSDLRIVTSAGSVLRWVAGKDFHLHLASVMGENFQENTEMRPEALKMVHDGVKEAKLWWSEHKGQFPALIPAPAIAEALRPGPVSQFSLTDLNGKKVWLSDFRGKAVLLNFWATWCAACFLEVPALLEFQKLHPEVVVLGIALDGAHHDHDAAPNHVRTVEESEKIFAAVRAAVQARHITYPILMDPDGMLSARFSGGELPTNVLLDKDHILRRRFVGQRSRTAFEAMLAETKRQ